MSEVQHFTGNIKRVIINSINSAQDEIRIAVSWLTDMDLVEVLNSKAREGILIEVILNLDDINLFYLESYSEMQRLGAQIFFYKDDDFTSSIMHKKFAVIDNRYVITGSYNWTNNAQNNLEDIYLIKTKTIVNSNLVEFERLKNLCKGVDLEFKGLQFKDSKAYNDDCLNWWNNLQEAWRAVFTYKLRARDPDDKGHMRRILYAPISVEEIKELKRRDAFSITIREDDSPPSLYFDAVWGFKVALSEPLENLNPIASLSNLESLSITVDTNSKQVLSYTDIGKLFNLKKFKAYAKRKEDLIDILHSVKDLPFLSDLSLWSLELQNGDFFPMMPSIKKLDLALHGLKNINVLSKFPNVEKLNYNCHNSNIRNFEIIATFTKLRELTFDSSSVVINDISFLNSLTNLEKLSIRFNSNKIDPIIQLEKLKKLTMYPNQHIFNVDDILNLKCIHRLEYIHIPIESLEINEDDIVALEDLFPNCHFDLK